MKTPVETLRTAFEQLNEGKTGWKADDEPPIPEIFAPSAHSSALDPERALVVGNRGVGKSFWAGVLAHERSRLAAGEKFERLHLDKCLVTLAFHEAAAAGLDADAPSVEFFQTFERKGVRPLQIWQGVLLAALRRSCRGADLQPAGSLEQAVTSVTENPLGFQQELRAAVQWLTRENRRFVLVFDALDRLDTSWKVIRPRTQGLLQLALQLRASKNLRCKIFMRPDQRADSTLFDFPDASKLIHDSVELQWRRSDLYGLLFHQLWNKPDCRAALPELLLSSEREHLSDKSELPASLLGQEEVQAKLFYHLAGEFMGAGPNKGRTYSWLYDHLGDGAGEVSPRSFMAALVEAALQGSQNGKTPLSYKGLIIGVQKASGVRLTQLQEDYAWVEETLRSLEGLQVPFEPAPFIQRWKERETTQKILEHCRINNRLPPVSLVDHPPEPEQKLLEELIKIRVMERRTNGKINIPDIFRVAAAIKRKGGIRPPRGRKTEA